jgi:hypothetical protein
MSGTRREASNACTQASTAVSISPNKCSAPTSRKLTEANRPLGLPTPEDKIVQGAMAEVLNAIYEADFPGSATASARLAAPTRRCRSWIGRR